MNDDGVTCPYCGELIDIDVDGGGGSSQVYVEDCQVCCRPMSVRVTTDEDGEPSVAVGRLDE